MLKTLSAALLAVTVLAAPAVAGPYNWADEEPEIRVAPFSATVLNAHWEPHHRYHRWRHFHHRHYWRHRHHWHHHHHDRFHYYRHHHHNHWR